MAGELTFFEIGVEDAQRGRAFYEALFGWTFEPGPSGGGGFGITAPNVAGGMHGGDKGAAPYVFFAVDDIDAAADRVRELGGEIEDMDMDGEEESVAKFGRFKLCKDDQGVALRVAPARSSPKERQRKGEARSTEPWMASPIRPAPDGAGATTRREGAGRFEVPLRPANRLQVLGGGPHTSMASLFATHTLASGRNVCGAASARKRPSRIFREYV